MNNFSQVKRKKCFKMLKIGLDFRRTLTHNKKVYLAVSFLSRRDKQKIKYALVVNFQGLRESKNS